MAPAAFAVSILTPPLFFSSQACPATGKSALLAKHGNEPSHVSKGACVKQTRGWAKRRAPAAVPADVDVVRAPALPLKHRHHVPHR